MHYHDGNTAHTSAQNYRDLNGHMKTFTVVDHDPKTKISVPTGGNPTEELEQSREALIQKILNIPAVYAAHPHWNFTIRGEEAEAAGGVSWHENMLRDKGTPFILLSDIYTLASNLQNLPSGRGF